MLERFAPVVLAAASALVAAAPGALAQDEQKVSLAADFKEGRTLTYRVDRTIELTQTAGEGEPVPTRTNQSFTGVFTVKSVDAEGAANVSLKFSRIALSNRIGGEAAPQSSFVWEDGSDLPAEPADPAAAAPAERIGRALAGAEITFRISPDGEIGSFGGIENLAVALRDLADQERWMAGMFMLDQMVHVLRQVFTVEGTAGAPDRRVGNGWQTAETVGLGAAGALGIETNWRLASLEKGIAKIEGAQEVDLQVPAQADHALPKAALDSAEGAVVIRWNTADGALQGRVVEQGLGLTFTLGDITVKQTQTNRTAIERIAN